MLATTRGLDLTAASQFQVLLGRLVSESYEKVIIAGEDIEEGPESNGDADRKLGGCDSNGGNDGVVGDGGVDDVMSTWLTVVCV